jgi:hypothetical protein
MLTFIVVIIILALGVLGIAMIFKGVYYGIKNMILFFIYLKTPGIIIGLIIVASCIPGIPSIPPVLSLLLLVSSFIWILVRAIRESLKDRKALKNNRNFTNL